MSFGSSLQKERKKNNISVKDFAKEIGVVRSYVTLIENDKRLPGKQILPKIAQALNIPIDVAMHWYFSEIKKKIIQKQRLFEF